MNIRKIIKEEVDDFEWVGSVRAELPHRDNIFGTTKSINITLSEYIELKYGYNFITVFLEDGRIVDLDTNNGLTYHTHESLREMLQDQDLFDFYKEGYTINDYLTDFTMSPADSELSEFIHKAIPFDIVGVYVGNN